MISYIQNDILYIIYITHICAFWPWIPFFASEVKITMCYFLSNFLETIGFNCSSYFPIHSPPSRHERFSHLTSSNRFPRVFAPPATQLAPT